MEYGIFDLMELLGSLVIFLYGMKLMSESLQKVASNKMRSILSAMTSNRLKGVLTGLLITALIQSSSATTVMLVSFVNAGLLSLTQSIGIVMGANIGTTVTAWIISIFGFKMEISHYVLPLLAISLPLIFSSKKSRNSWGGVIIGFSLIFIGLDFLKGATPDINSNPDIMVFLTKFSNWGFGSVIVFMIIGTLLTIIMQSSSAVMAITLVMCFNGWISFEMSAAMVLGQNLGTTITAILAALMANTTAKRTAMAHVMFNVIGIVLALIILNPFLNLVDKITISTGSVSAFPTAGVSADATAKAIPVALSIFHTIFNILNTLILIWFVPQIVKIVIKLVPAKEEEQEFSLKYINTGILSTNELSIIQAVKETAHYAEHICKMYNLAIDLIHIDSEKKANKIIKKIEKAEDISDNTEEEIAQYLTHISEESLSSQATEKINQIFFVISHLEDIADVCNNIGKTFVRKQDKKTSFPIELIQKLDAFSKEILIQLQALIPVIDNGKDLKEKFLVLKKSNDKIVMELETLRNNHFKDLKKGVYKCKDGIIYSDLYSDMGKIASLSYSIIKFIEESKKTEIS